MEEVVVIGLGYVGLPLALLAAKKGFKVTGFDINKDKINNLSSGVCEIPGIIDKDLIELQDSGVLKFTKKLSKFISPTIFVIAVPTPLDLRRNPDLSYLEEACLSISKVISNGSLVITESTSYIGTLSEFIKPLIEKFTTASDLHFAVAPERIDPGNEHWDLSNTPRVVGGISKKSVHLASHFYSSFCKKVIQVSSPEVAEAAKLLENTFRQVNIALVNEISVLTRSINISMHEVVDAASSKPFGFMEFRPGIGVGGHCIPVDPVYLGYSGDKNNVKMDLVKLSNLKNQNQVKYVSNYISTYFKGNLNGKKIQIVGISYKKNISDTRESPAIELINELRKLGAKVFWHDPIVKSFMGEKSEDLRLDIDLGIVITQHKIINFQSWSDIKFKILDLSPGDHVLGLPKFF